MFDFYVSIFTHPSICIHAFMNIKFLGPLRNMHLCNSLACMPSQFIFWFFLSSRRILMFVFCSFGVCIVTTSNITVGRAGHFTCASMIVVIAVGWLCASHYCHCLLSSYVHNLVSIFIVSRLTQRKVFETSNRSCVCACLELQRTYARTSSERTVLGTLVPNRMRVHYADWTMSHEDLEFFKWRTKFKKPHYA